MTHHNCSTLMQQSMNFESLAGGKSFRRLWRSFRRQRLVRCQHHGHHGIEPRLDPCSIVKAENRGVLRGKPSLGGENVAPNSRTKLRFCLRNNQPWRNYVEEKKATRVFSSQTHRLLCLAANRGEFSRRRAGASAGLEPRRAPGGAPGQRAVGGAAALRATLLPETDRY